VQSAKHINGSYPALLMWLSRVDRNARSKPQSWNDSSLPACFSLRLVVYFPAGHLIGHGKVLP
jgi:hypothetical protein